VAIPVIGGWPAGGGHSVYHVREEKDSPHQRDLRQYIILPWLIFDTVKNEYIKKLFMQVIYITNISISSNIFGWDSSKINGWNLLKSYYVILMIFKVQLCHYLFNTYNGSNYF